jgi:hypothetical protein
MQSQHEFGRDSSAACTFHADLQQIVAEDVGCLLEELLRGCYLLHYVLCMKE